MAYYVAFDIGGTFIKYALLQDEGTIINKAKVETPHSLNELYQVLTHIVNAFKQTHHIEGIAISAPGAVDSDTGIIKGASALPYIHGPNIKTDLEKLTNLRVEIENDANCAALAEVWLGNAKNTKDAMFVVIGTGIGGAIIKDRKIHRGVHLHGGEFGYTVQEFDSSTLTFKTWSDIGSTNALVQNVAKQLKCHLSGEEIFERAKTDEICKKAVEDFYFHLAIGIYNLQYVYDPKVIIIGGGISNQPQLVDEINKRLDTILDKIKIAKIKPNVMTCAYKCC